MGYEITNIDKKSGYVVTIKYTPNFILKLFGVKSNIKKYYSDHGIIWFDVETGECYPNNIYNEFSSTTGLLNNIRKVEIKAKIKAKIKKLNIQ